MLSRTLTIAQLNLIQKEIGGLRTEIVKLRHELASRQQYAERLEVLLRERLERIDDLNGKLEQAREQNKRLKAEAEHLAQLVAAPPVNASIPKSATDAAKAYLMTCWCLARGMLQHAQARTD